MNSSSIMVGGIQQNGWMSTLPAVILVGFALYCIAYLNQLKRAGTI
jgi:hypothetical protein